MIVSGLRYPNVFLARPVASPETGELGIGSVLWTNGSQCGAEFIKMREKERRQLNQVMARHLSNRVLTQEEKRQRFNEPGGQKRHLDT